LDVSTHAPPHSIALVGQVNAHVPLAQASPAAQTLPHAPQLPLSLCAFTHTPAQSMSPDEQFVVPLGGVSSQPSASSTAINGNK